MKPENNRESEFENFVTEYRCIIDKVCWTYASDENSWQDLRQEVLINLWRGFDTFGSRAKMSTWVWRVALNTCISDLRRNRRYRGTLPLPACAGMSGDSDHERDERLRELHELIGRLSHLERTIVMMWLDEHSYDEIAVVTGLTRNNVAARLHRIKEKLSKLAQQQTH